MNECCIHFAWEPGAFDKVAEDHGIDVNNRSELSAYLKDGHHPYCANYKGTGERDDDEAKKEAD